MTLLLDEKACLLSADELVAYVRLSFNTDKEGYVHGTNRELASITGMSVPRYKKSISGLFEKQMVSIGKGKVFIWRHENITFANGDVPKTQEPDPVVKLSSDKTESRQSAEVAKKVCDYFNRVINGKGMPQIQALTPKRKSAINARIKEHGLQSVYAVMDNAAASKFLNESPWASFDWIFRPNNFVKVLEGNYGGNKSTNKSAEQQYYQGVGELIQRLNSKRETESN